MNDKLEIGDEVLVIDASIKPENMASVVRNFPCWIKEDSKEIIRDIMFNDDIVVGIVLESRRNPQIWMPLLKRMQEPAFAYWRFRKTKSAYMIQEEKESEGIKVDELIKEIDGDIH